MKIHNALYVTSSARTDQCPKPDKPEYAFIGRSNVGKSSLINMLTGRKKLKAEQPKNLKVRDEITAQET